MTTDIKMENLSLISTIVQPSDMERIIAIANEIEDTMQKRQVFRTDTEARLSVLNDGSFPTKASKYWQSVREQAVMFEQLALMNFEMRRCFVNLKKLQRAMKDSKDALEIEFIQIEIDECNFKLANLRTVAKDRVREIFMWSQIKSELDDGTFDTKDVNTHQPETLRQQLDFRMKSMPEVAAPAEIMNVIGPMATVNAVVKDGKILPYNKLLTL